MSEERKPPTMVQTLIEFDQAGDCCDTDHQYLKLKRDNGGTTPDDEFYVIETTRWSFDSIEEFVTLLRKAGCRECVRMEGTAP